MTERARDNAEQGSAGRIYPVGLRLAGRRVVVVGGGQVAHRRVIGLLTAGALVEVISPRVVPAVDAMSSGGEITWTRRNYAEGDLADCWYAIAATDDPAVNAAVAEEAERRRVFCARADDARTASAWTPATGRHGQLTVAVVSDGQGVPGENDETTPRRDPRRSAAVRDAVLERLHAGTLLTDAGATREDADRLGSPDQAPSHPLAGTVALVGGGPGDPDLITVRGRRLLARADVVVADRLGPRALLDELPGDVEIIDASKIPYGRAMAQEEINRLLVEHARAGRFVVRLKGGDPYVFGRGFEEMLACAEAGVPCTVVPGITSGIAVPELAGVPVTHRGVAHEFTVVSAHLSPDDPASLVDWSALARLRGTLVLLMAVRWLGRAAEKLIEHGREPATPVLVVQDGTTAAERRLVSTLRQVAADCASADIRPPAVVVIGEVVAFARGGDTAPQSSRR